MPPLLISSRAGYRQVSDYTCDGTACAQAFGKGNDGDKMFLSRRPGDGCILKRYDVPDYNTRGVWEVYRERFPRSNPALPEDPSEATSSAQKRLPL